MSKTRPDIWLPLYIGDYLADTQHLSAEQHGAYLLLLMHQWKVGPLLADSSVLARIARIPDSAWSTAWNVLSRFFEQDVDGNLFQARLERERAAWGQKKAVYVARARNAALEKHRKAKEKSASSTASRMLEGVLGSCPSPPPPPLIKNLALISAEAVKDAKESNKKAPSDPRHVPVRRYLESSLTRAGVVFAWNASAAGALSALLKGIPDKPESFVRELIDSLMASDVRFHTEKLPQLIAGLLRFQRGPLDKHSQVIRVTPTTMPARRYAEADDAA